MRSPVPPPNCDPIRPPATRADQRAGILLRALPGFRCGSAGGDRDRDDRGSAQANDIHISPPITDIADGRRSPIGGFADAGSAT